ncbi:hypothetical protein AUR04nite_16710 [Glutamicibacter uratoxydans]|uniref:Lipoprotein n=1 Tax=Glutamicibacter uratoxydans TaxID=43667 RepID=A0A4Y4DLE4_GLUUR|nr:hypothetical protein [Glutamicibacter uratoxydans]GED06139.1 hypothetical protein AUR04nite_16710 [Glutamicibacter uratoxydans]
MVASVRIVSRSSLVVGLCTLSLALASCSTAAPDAAPTGAASSSAAQSNDASPRSTTQPVGDVDSQKTTAIKGLSWGDGSKIEAVELAVDSAVKPADSEISGRAAHTLPKGEDFIGVLSDGRPVVVRDQLPFTVDAEGTYTLYWPNEEIVGDSDTTRFSVQGDLVLAVTSKSKHDKNLSDVAVYAPGADSLKKISNVENAADFVVAKDRIYWATNEWSGAQVLSASFADGKPRVEAKNAAAVYNTPQGIAILKLSKEKTESGQSKVAGIELLNGKKLLQAGQDFELGGFSGDGLHNWPAMQNGTSVSFDIDSGKADYKTVVLNLDTQKAWQLDLPADRAAFATSTSGNRTFSSWSMENPEELGQLGNEAVVLDSVTGKLFAFTPKNNFEEIYANDKAVAWSTVTKDGSVSFASEILK